MSFDLEWHGAKMLDAQSAPTLHSRAGKLHEAEALDMHVECTELQRERFA